ncbi:enoyl-CoA hydratase [Desertimonas flava]|uniref:enoyl-CoA hydratase n=1 Tax=Desertimonas flava TaxID=2064846 RepID=UPI000E34DADE|nr:enoyl-CoA hydratase [Desertimonas flava]
MTEDLVRLDISERIGTVTLNRPERRNAISSALARAVTARMNQAIESDEVDVIVLTGSGRAFCAGLDLVELSTSAHNLSPLDSEDGPWTPGNGMWVETDKPVIGAINGPAVTGGLELALHCDILIAAESARFGDTHARVGVFPGGGMIALLPRAIGQRAALAMSLSGNFIDASTALRWGLVVDVVPDEELPAAARRLAADIASADQRIVRAVLATYREAADLSPTDAVAHEGAVARRMHALVDPATIAGRREAVLDRGRAQTAVD